MIAKSLTKFITFLGLLRYILFLPACDHQTRPSYVILQAEETERVAHALCASKRSILDLTDLRKDLGASTAISSYYGLFLS